MASVQVPFGKFNCMLCTLCVYAFNPVGVNLWIKVNAKYIKYKLRENVIYILMSKCYNKQCFFSQL